MHKSFLDEISGPFIPPPDSGSPVVSIRTELPKLIEAGIKELNQDQLDRLIDFYFRRNSSTSKKKYKERHPEEYRMFFI